MDSYKHNLTIFWKLRTVIDLCFDSNTYFSGGLIYLLVFLNTAWQVLQTWVYISVWWAPYMHIKTDSEAQRGRGWQKRKKKSLGL